MKKFKILLCASSLSGAILFLAVIPAADAQNTQGKWGVGIRGGGSFLTQDIAESTEGEAGPIISGNIIYGVTNSVSVGLNVEWETHNVEVLDFDIGDTTTVSILPFVELRATNGSFVPYASLGAGININSFDLGNDIVAGCIILVGSACELEPENTFALKVGVGADYFLTPTLALNVEGGWKLNSGDVDLEVGGVPVATDDFDVSAVSLLFGLRAYF